MNAFPRILVIDDDRFWLETLAEFLRRRGFVVLEAKSAYEALDVLDREEVALVISDYRLPGMDGLHLVRHLRQRRKRVAVVMVSNEEEPKLAERVLSAGALAFLAKTSAPGHLVRKIRQVIRSLLVKELAAPTVQLWQRLLPNHIAMDAGKTMIVLSTPRPA
jgi:DNA-binding response OmpR family regulator